MGLLMLHLAFRLFYSNHHGATRPIVHNRPIEEFTGSGVVIGCAQPCWGNKKLHDNSSEFYTIDRDSEMKPDLVFDITHPLPSQFHQRFQLTLVENIDAQAYNDFTGLGMFSSTSTPKPADGIVGFKNIWDMTHAEGFIVIVGCPRNKDCRQQIYARNLKYIELTTASILIPKNQQLDLIQIQKNINALPSALQNTIEQAKIHPIHTSELILPPEMSDPVLSKFFKNLLTNHELQQTLNETKISDELRILMMDLADEVNKDELRWCKLEQHRLTDVIPADVKEACRRDKANNKSYSSFFSVM